MDAYYAWVPPEAGVFAPRPLPPMLYAVLLGGLGTLALTAGGFRLTRKDDARAFEPPAPPAERRVTRPRP
jgi:hypothetical protein